jgi:hypothetical protein
MKKLVGVQVTLTSTSVLKAPSGRYDGGQSPVTVALEPPLRDTGGEPDRSVERVAFVVAPISATLRNRRCRQHPKQISNRCCSQHLPTGCCSHGPDGGYGLQLSSTPYARRSSGVDTSDLPTNLAPAHEGTFVTRNSGHQNSWISDIFASIAQDSTS